MMSTTTIDRTAPEAQVHSPPLASEAAAPGQPGGDLAETQVVPDGPTAPEQPGGDRPNAQAESSLPPDFNEWFHKHREPIYRYIRFRVATREIAEDLTSDVFVKALRARDSYDPKRSSPRTWLLRIARNTVTDHLRALQRRNSLHVSLDRVPDLVSQSPSQEERIIREEEIQRLLNAVATLRERDREILSLRYGSGLGNSEIAEALKISPNAVAVRIHRALVRLKAVVTDPEDE